MSLEPVYDCLPFENWSFTIDEVDSRKRKFGFCELDEASGTRLPSTPLARSSAQQTLGGAGQADLLFPRPRGGDKIFIFAPHRKSKETGLHFRSALDNSNT